MSPSNLSLILVRLILNTYSLVCNYHVNLLTLHCSKPNTMKILSAHLFALFALSSSAQKISSVSSDEMKVTVSTGFYETIYADEKESFFRYSTLPNPNFTTDRQSGINDLIKFDKDMKQVYAINLDSKIKEGAIYFILAVKDNIWIVYHDWEKKDKLLNLFARKLNKETGELDENIRAIGSITPAKEPEAYTISISPDYSTILIASRIFNADKEKTTVQVIITDNGFNKKSMESFDVNVPSEDYTIANAILNKGGDKLSVAGLVYKKTGKKKSTILTYLDHVLITTKDKSKSVSEVSFKAEGYMLSGSSFLSRWTMDDKLLMATYFCDPIKDNNYALFRNGVLTGRFDLNKGTVDYSVQNKFTRQDAIYLTNGFDRKKDSAYLNEVYKLKDLIDLGPDKGFVLIGEYSWSSARSVTSVSGNYSRELSGFSYGGLKIIRINSQGNREWLRPVAKYQDETYTTGAGFTYDHLPVMNPASSYHIRTDRFPIYSGYGMRIKNDQLQLVYNDDPTTVKSIEMEDIYKKVVKFDNSQMVMVSVNLSTGKAEKKLIATNFSGTILMPRFADTFGNYFFIPASKIKMKGLVKSELQLFKIGF